MFADQMPFMPANQQCKALTNYNYNHKHNLDDWSSSGEHSSALWCIL